MIDAERYTSRLVLMLRPSERRQIEDAAAAVGHRAVSDFVRLALGLEPAPRGTASHRKQKTPAPKRTRKAKA